MKYVLGLVILVIFHNSNLMEASTFLVIFFIVTPLWLAEVMSIVFEGNDDES